MFDLALIEQLTRLFEKLPSLFIADGHHRTASAANVCNDLRVKHPDRTGNEPYNFFMSVLFPSDQLNILPYNRVITELSDCSPETFLSRVRENFVVNKTQSNQLVLQSCG